MHRPPNGLLPVKIMFALLAELYRKNVVLSKKNLLLAGYGLYFIQLIICWWIVSLVMGVLNQNNTTVMNIYKLIIETILQITYLFIFVFSLIIFRKLLNEKFKIYDVDESISILIGFVIVSGILDIIFTPLFNFLFALHPVDKIAGGTFNRQDALIALASIIYLILIVLICFLWGLCVIIFVRKFSSVKVDLYGLRNQLVWANWITGICFVSIVLLPIGIVAGIMMGITLGRILLRASSTSDICSEARL